MGMPALDFSRRDWTASEVRQLGDPELHWPRYEVVDGELLVTPSPAWSHQKAILRLATRLLAYVDRWRVGAVLIAPADVEFTPRRYVQPDLFVAPLMEGREPSHFEDVGRLLLAVEVVSPGSGRADRQVKRRLYLSQGVPEYWIVDTDARLIERWRPGAETPEILTQRLSWAPSQEIEPLAIELEEYFGEVLGE